MSLITNKHRPQAPRQGIFLKIRVADMEDANVAALEQRVDDFVSKLRDDGVVVEVTTF